MKSVYLVPAPDMDERSVRAIQLEGCEVFPLRLPPLDLSTDLDGYLVELKSQICHERPVLLGVCYGGVLALELAKITDPARVVVVSSVKSRDELALSRKALGMFYLGFPNSVLTGFGVGLSFLLNRVLCVKVKIPRIWRKSGQNRFIVRHLLGFRGYDGPVRVVHIHGRRDTTFPLRAIGHVDVVIDSGHFMLDTRRRLALVAIAEAVRGD